MSKHKRRSRNLNSLELSIIEPLTHNQEKAFSSKKNMVLCGSAGTGKSYISCFLGLEKVFRKRYDQLIIIRSAVPTRDIGFLPGTDKEKTKVYEEPYKALCAELFERGDAYDHLKNSGIVEFMTTSYIRGITLKDAYIVVDECQNMTLQELDSLITRIGDNCTIVFSGDFRQTDLKNNGLAEFMQTLSRMNTDFDIIEFNKNDVVRSGLVKRYLETRDYNA